MADENNLQNSWTPSIKASLMTAAISAISSIAVASITTAQQTAPLRQASVGSLSEGQKLCSILVSGNWRDNLIVPKTWSTGNCQELQIKMGATEFQLGCVYNNSISLGRIIDNNLPDDSPERIPAKNCDW